MGITYTKEHKKQPYDRRISRSLDSVNYNENKKDIVVSEDLYDKKIIEAIKAEWKDSPQVFILNNILLGIIFFENYQRELTKLKNSTATKLEKQLNPKLIEEETKCITPDVIFSHLDRYIRFQRVHGPNKEPEPLLVKRFYVAYENIEVISAEGIYDTHYSAIDKPICQVKLEEIELENNRRKQGFMRLRVLGKYTKNSEATEEKKEEVIDLISDEDDEDEEYGAIIDSKTPKPLNIITNSQRRTKLPKSCFKIVSKENIKKHQGDATKENTPSTSKVPDDAVVNNPQENLYIQIPYISSRGFMEFFQNEVFPNTLGKHLGFKKEDIAKAKAMPGVILCNRIAPDDSVIPCEVIPSVPVEWPAQAYDFHKRASRPIVTDSRTHRRYKWPTNEMINDVRNFNCVLIPRGCILKKGNNTADSEIEWEICFPKAERYLETKMSNTQIRCLIFLLVIHKTYIEPVTQSHGLLPEHIRNHMFWECETNPKDWPEHRLGTKLIRVIHNLNSSLSKGILRHYFISRKNVFENIPKKYLHFAQKVFHDVLQSPVQYFMMALRNITYTSKEFYPVFQYKALAEILGCKEGIKHSNRKEVVRNNSSMKQTAKKPDIDEDESIKWRRKRDADRKKQILEQRLQQKQQKEQEDSKNPSVPRISNDSIEMQEFDWENISLPKTRDILIFFINTLIEIAQKSSTLGPKEQTLFYLKEASYLSEILKENRSFYVDYLNFREVIEKEEEKCKRKTANELVEEAPPTPQRNSAQFTFTLTQQTKSNFINLDKLQKSYNQPLQKANAQGTKLRYTSSAKMNGSDVNRRKSVGFSSEVEKLAVD